MDETYVFSDLQFGWKWGPITWLLFRLWGLSRLRSNAGALLGVFKILEAAQQNGRRLRIILNGDTLDRANMEWVDLHPDEQDCILALRHLRSSGAEVVVLTGNHDHDGENLARILQLPVAGRDYNFNISNSSVLVTHGDRFEHQKKHWVWVGDAAVFLFALTGQVRWLFHLPPYKKHAREMREEALKYINPTNFRAILIGHNHFASLTEQDGKIFGNSGCVVQNYPLTFMKLERDNIALMEYTIEGNFQTIKEITL